MRSCDAAPIETIKLTPEYMKKEAAIAGRQLAGYRQAALLNEIWPWQPNSAR